MSTEVSKNTLTIKEAIESRVSIRKFVQENISEEKIQQILDLVRLTPSAWNLQPWRFHVVTNQQLKEKLQDAASGQKQVTSAPAVIIVTSDMEDTLKNLSETVHPGMPEDRRLQEVENLSSHFNSMSLEERGQWGLTQTNIALGFLLLTIQGFGYSSVPMLGFDQEKVREILGLAEHVKFAAIVPFGRSAEEGFEHHRFELNKIVTFH